MKEKEVWHKLAHYDHADDSIPDPPQRLFEISAKVEIWYQHESHEPNWSKLQFLPRILASTALLQRRLKAWPRMKSTLSNYYLAPINSQSTAVCHTFRVIPIAVENWCSNTLHKSKCHDRDDYTNNTSRVCDCNILKYLFRFHCKWSNN